MPLAIRPFSADWRPAVRQFNARLDAAGAAPGLRLPEEPEIEMLPGSDLYLAVDDAIVRGGYVLRPQQFSFHGAMRRVAHYRLPLSEGIIDKRYAAIGPLLLRSALQTEPLLYALGMGGFDRPLPRMLQAMGWKLWPVPFYFRVVHPTRFLRQMRALRRNSWRAALMDLAAWTGAGWLGTRFLQRRSVAQASRPILVDDWTKWADEGWNAACACYGAIAQRDAATLRQLYPSSTPRFIRLQVKPDRWAVVLDTAMQDDQYFGNLRVGTIVDCLARPEHAPAVVQAARVFLESRGVDLIISNQAHSAWTGALRADGFLEGPSNFLLGASRALTEMLGAINEVHVNRGDGDGPIHL